MSMTSDKPSLPRGYPLGALFLLVATCAGILALVTLLMREPKRLDEMLVPILTSAAVGAVVLMLMGIVVGLFHFSRVQGIAWGLLVGGLLGLGFGPILYISASSFPHVLLTSLVGAPAAGRHRHRDPTHDRSPRRRGPDRRRPVDGRRVETPSARSGPGR